LTFFEENFRIIQKIPGFRNVIILIRFVSFRFTNISFRSVSFHDLIIFLTFRFVSFQKNIVSFRNVSWSCKFYFVPFCFVSENYAFLAFRSVPFRFVSKPCLLILVHKICKPVFNSYFVVNVHWVLFSRGILIDNN
jgi:hypothetical protein